MISTKQLLSLSVFLVMIWPLPIFGASQIDVSDSNIIGDVPYVCQRGRLD